MFRYVYLNTNYNNTLLYRYAFFYIEIKNIENRLYSISLKFPNATLMNRFNVKLRMKTIRLNSVIIPCHLF